MTNTNQKRSLVDKWYRGADPFKYFNADKKHVDLQGWASGHSFLAEAVKQSQPSVIIEIGVWKGMSVITLASEVRRQDLDAVVIAIDTWRGSHENWSDDEWFKSLRIENGTPHIQETFMCNIIEKGLQDCVLPLPLDSINGSILCKKTKLSADVIHIDAGHDYKSVSSDLEVWTPLLRDGGTLIMDDYRKNENGEAIGWADVAYATDEFIARNKERVKNFRFHGNKCAFELSK